jgi:hypothetical protein
VEGAFRPRDNRSGSAPRIRQHALRGDADHPIPVIFHEPAPPIIGSGTIAHAMNDAVDLYDQPRAQAAEIRHIGTYRMLATKFHATRLSAKMLPQCHFRRRHGPPKLPGTVHDRTLCGR